MAVFPATISDYLATMAAAQVPAWAVGAAGYPAAPLCWHPEADRLPPGAVVPVPLQNGMQ